MVVPATLVSASPMIPTQKLRPSPRLPMHSSAKPPPDSVASRSARCSAARSLSRSEASISCMVAGGGSWPRMRAASSVR